MQACVVSTVNARPSPDIFMLGTRDVAEPLRAEVEKALESGSDRVRIDFSGLSVTQSFMDEFLGVLVLRYGPGIFRRVELTNCADDVRGIAEFVAGVRLRDYNNRRT